MNNALQAQDAKSLDFESTLAELEKVVAELEGEVKLERALELFECGMKLSGQCRSFLETAEQKVEVLRRNADGALSLEPLVAAEGESD